jgi:hypothetical protein
MMSLVQASTEGHAEAITDWRKASYCNNGASCIEVGHGKAGVGIRDSKLAGSSPVLAFSAEEWRDFGARVRRGEAVMGGDD